MRRQHVGLELKVPLDTGRNLDCGAAGRFDCLVVRGVARIRNEHAIARIDEGEMFPVAFAVLELTPAAEARIVELVKKAAA